MNRRTVLREYEPGDEVGIDRLFHEVFGEARPPGAWRWKFAEGPIDSRPLIVVATDGDAIVGQYACLASRLKYRDRSLVSATPVDNMIQQAYRGGMRGLQVKMFTKARKIWLRSDCDIVWGFPNPEAYKVGKRLLEYERRIEVVNLFFLLGWGVAAKKVLDVAPLAAAADRVGRAAGAARLRRWARQTGGLEYERVPTFDEGVDRLWDRVRARYPLVVERTRAHLNWRYVANPGARYERLVARRDGETVGLIVWRVVQHGAMRVGFVLDVVADDDAEVWRGLAARAMIAMNEDGADYALVRFAAGDPTRARLESLGFRHRAGLWDEIVVFETYSDALAYDDVQDAGNWMISFGDCESL